MRRKLVLLAALAWAVPARAEWLPAQGRSFSRATSASRDAPVLELAYGPRSYGSIGLEPALYAHRSGRGRFVVGFSALLAFENEDTTPVVPDQPLWRDVAGAFVAHAFGDLEIAGFIGHEASFAVDRPPDAYRPTDIPFGGGGWFVAPDIALRSGVTASVELTSRLGDRLYTNFFPALVGQREESDYVADFLREGSSQMPFAELSLRWKLAPWLRPVVSVYGEALVPHDDSAKAGVLVRGLFGAGFTGAAGTLTPFVAAAAGNGKGWLVNRQELSLSLGVRLSLESAP